MEERTAEEQAKIDIKLAWDRANARTPEEWKAAVDSITDAAVRTQVACVVWWDFFGHRPAKSPWPHLDELRAQWNKSIQLDSSVVRDALIQVGYPAKVAHDRATGYDVNRN